jgi:uncharacterized protein involved in exopolysaccharide biosynthesis
MVVITGMAATFLITPKYEATMSILVSKGKVDPQITAADKNVEITQTAVNDAEFNSELELFKSLDVITSVVKDLDLVKDRKPKEDTSLSKWRGRIKASFYGLITTNSPDGERPSESKDDLNLALERTVNLVAGNLEVVPVKKSRVIKITYTDTDPNRAKKTLDAIYHRFVDLHVELNERGTTQVFDEQTGKFSQKLNAATDKLKNFDTQNGVIGADINTQQGLLQRQLSDTQTQISATKTQVGETEKRIASLKSKIAAEPQQIQTGWVSKYVPAMDKIKEELIQLEQQRTQLLQKYQPNSRFVRENQERIDQLKRTLAAETANPPQERSYALNELRRKLEAELHDAQTSLAALKEREKTLVGQATKLSGEVAFLNTKSIERTGLERQRSLNEEAYLLYEKKSRENEVGQVLNRERIMDFAVVDPPRTDGEQKNPKPLLNLLVLIGVGTMAAFAGAVTLEKFSAKGYDNDLVRAPHEIEGRLNIPLLAAIPTIHISELAGMQNASNRRALLESGEDISA